VDTSPSSAESVRLDRWLWAARFFKTRQLATAAVSGGKVHVDGNRAKPGRRVRPGSLVRIRRGHLEIEVRIVELSERRGPAIAAQALYMETDASRAAREQVRPRAPMVAPTARPNKRDRQRLRRLRGRET
jgi:ribosome-associated heat shock protein Hsp15